MQNIERDLPDLHPNNSTRMHTRSSSKFNLKRIGMKRK